MSETDDRLRFHALVVSDLHNAVDWYDGISPDLGNHFRAVVDDRLDAIAERPESFPTAFDIPAGLCYQRLSVDGVGPPYCLHGLTAVFLSEFGWYRVDARGNRHGIHADFTPPKECLAFSTNLSGEYDLPGIRVAPLPVVVKSLRGTQSWDELLANLPDV